MLNLEKYVLHLAAIAKKLTYRQVILGEERHPARITRVFSPPPYVQIFDNASYFSEVACVVGGKCVITLNGKSYLLREGDLCLVNHGIKNFESYLEKNIGYEVIWLSHRTVFDLRVHHARYHPAASYEAVSHLAMKIKPESSQLLEDIFLVPEPRKHFGLIRGKMVTWFTAISENIRQGNYIKKVNTARLRYQTTLKTKRIRPAVEYIKKHYREKLTLRDIAAQVGLSSAYFCVFFKEAYDLSLFDFIIDLRLKEACRLLKTTVLNVSEISPQVGYANPYFFSRIFKKWFGLPPVRFRERFLPRFFVNDPHY